jgi:hypothetical protein
LPVARKQDAPQRRSAAGLDEHRGRAEHVPGVDEARAKVGCELDVDAVLRAPTE